MNLLGRVYSRNKILRDFIKNYADRREWRIERGAPKLGKGAYQELFEAVTHALPDNEYTPTEIRCGVQEVRIPGSDYGAGRTAPIPNDPHYHELMNADCLRSSPGKESAFCKETIRILNLLAPQGHGLLIGTPTAEAVCPGDKSWGHRIIDDNLDVAKAIKKTTRSMEICVGNAANEVKAQFKVTQWKLNMPKSIKIYARAITLESYYNIIAGVAERQQKKGNIVKVVFMMSGKWKGTYQLISKLLCTHYGNLIIIGMTTENRLNLVPSVVASNPSYVPWGLI